MSEEHSTVFYPRYFSISSTKFEGRRLPKSLCIEKPTITEIANALKQLNIEVTENPKKRYPRSAVEAWDIGSVSFQSQENKIVLLKQVGAILLKTRKA
ncbi:SRP19 protein [Spironucleus salmonicida]|uniref:SRP19 protein n=1 Tax=Spironucleus salmonicida TaxID=348837 RepID=V6LDJ4_9EUKA|nr:SRP19 protein [Spironucleus salmonicida]|eukprot:EST42580.1 Signal recognition particle 19 kDa protein [Spironucleus salmonicida]